MPLPLLPFAIKGAIVLGKFIIAKGASAKVAAVAVQTVKAVGVANAVAGAAAACIIVGGVMWTAENVKRAQRAYTAAGAGDLSTAAQQLMGIAGSIQGAFSNDLAGELQAWGVDGYPIDGRVITLATHAYQTAQQALPDSEA